MNYYPEKNRISTKAIGSTVDAGQSATLGKYVMTDKPLCPHCDEHIDVFVPSKNYVFKPGIHAITCDHCEAEVQVHSEPVYWFSTDDQPACRTGRTKAA